jgi:hypothetical protein
LPSGRACGYSPSMNGEFHTLLRLPAGALALGLLLRLAR